MIAITTSSSMSVKPRGHGFDTFFIKGLRYSFLLADRERSG